jgi:hypothetical protein
MTTRAYSDCTRALAGATPIADDQSVRSFCQSSLRDHVRVAPSRTIAAAATATTR